MAEKPRSAELHPGPGFRIRTDCPRLPSLLMEQLSAFPTPEISDLLNRMYALNPAIHCLTGGDHRLWGPACTVRVFPGDNLMVHKSLDIVRPGDVIVVDAGGSPMNAVLGDLVATKAKHRGVAGFVVDGLVRDLPGIQAVGLPVYARGTTPIGPLHRGPGEINFPICCGGVVVNPAGVVQQMQSAIVYGLSAALRGAITIDRGRVVQTNFHQYEPLRIHEMPVVEVHIVPSTQAPGGIGEVGTPAIAPAVVNAVSAALGRRIRRLPLSLENLA